MTIVTVSWFALSDNLTADFGPLDDSELLAWLNQDGRLPAEEAWSTLVNETDIGQFRDRPRLRPAFAVTRVLETVAFGDNATGHYLSVLGMFAATVALLGTAFAWWVLVASRIKSLPATIGLSAGSAIIASLLIASLGSWTGIVARLGTSERIAGLGFALMVLGLTALILQRSAWWWIPALLGAWIAVLGKENFLLISLAPIAVGVYRVLSLKRSRAELFVVPAALLPAVVLVWALAPAATSGSDPYGASTGLDRLTSALSALFVTYRWYWIPAAVMVILSWAVWTWVLGRAHRAIAVLLFTLISVGVLLRGYDGWIYGIHGYLYPRYESIPDLLKVTAIVGSFALALAAFRRAGVGYERLAAGIVLLLSFLFILNSLRAVPAAMEALKAESRANSEATIAYSRSLDEISRIAQDSKADFVAIVPTQPIDGVENIRSLATELKRRNPEVQLLLLPDLTSSQQQTPMGMGLGALSVDGSETLGIAPQSEAAPTDVVVCAVINRSTTGRVECRQGFTREVPVRFM